MSSSTSRGNTQVSEIMEDYRRVNQLHPLLSDLFRIPDFEGMFWDTLSNEHFVLTQRSQNLADGDITIMQKAFVALFQNQDEQLPAACLWIEEILGLSLVVEAKKAAALTSAVQIRARTLDLHEQQSNQALQAESMESGSKRPKYKRHVLGVDEPSSETLVFSHDTDKSPDDRSDYASRTSRSSYTVDNSRGHFLSASHNDDKLKQLIDTYDRAKCEFQVAPPKSLDRTKCAKFLRDTIENCITYLGAKQQPIRNVHGGDMLAKLKQLKPRNADEAKILAEMSTMLEETKAVAEKGSGGKKRSFDEGADVGRVKLMKTGLPMSKKSITLTPKKRSHDEHHGESQMTAYDSHANTHRSEHERQPARLAERITAPAVDYRQQRIDAGTRRRSASPERTYFQRSEQDVGRGRGRSFRGRGKPTVGDAPLAPYGVRDAYRPKYH